MNSRHATSLPSDPAHAPPKRHGLSRLDQLPPGRHGVVQSIDQSDLAVRRLMAMGLCEGREVEVLQQGNPLVVRLLGARIGISVRLARLVQVGSCACARCKGIDELKGN